MAAVLLRLLVETGFVAAELPALRRLEADEAFFLELVSFLFEAFLCRYGVNERDYGARRHLLRNSHVYFGGLGQCFWYRSD